MPEESISKLQTITEVNENNLQAMLERSMSMPVLFYFYSDRSPHCAPLIVILEKLVNQHQGQILLAKVDCDQQPMVAAQFGLRAIPTVCLLQNGQTVDGFQGPQSEETIRRLLEKYLPREDELKTREAQQLIAQGKTAEALPLLKDAWRLSQQNSETGLLLAQLQISLKRFTEAQSVLQTIPIQDQDSRYQGLLAQIELQKKAADTPEIQQLQQQLDTSPQDMILVSQLALQLHQVERDEEALALLLQHLRRDLQAADGKLLSLCKEILAALGTGDSLAGKYRRQLYALLY